MRGEGRGNIFTRAWRRVAGWFSDLIQDTNKLPDVKVMERARHAELKRMEKVSRNIPRSAQFLSPH